MEMVGEGVGLDGDGEGLGLDGDGEGGIRGGL